MKRIGIDANILLRVLLNDAPGQSASARRFLASLDEDKQGYVGVPAALEVFWVLGGRNRIPRDRVALAFDAMLTIDHVEFESFDAIKRAIDAYADGSVDFPDALLAGRNQEAGCAGTMTFDRKAAERIGGMELLT